MDASPILTTFDAGELSPLMGGRVDFEKYPNGCTTLENFIATVQGAAVRRGGTTFIAGVKTDADRTWLKSFIVSDGTKYMLEFGNYYCRVYANRGALMSGGVQVEFATPYSRGDMISAEGTFTLRFAQSADTLYIFHGSYPTYKLVRTGATAFTYEIVSFTSGPFQDQNIDESIVITASAISGAVSLTASANVFTAADVGTIMFLKQKDFSDVRPWATYKQIAVGDFRRVDERIYKAVGIGPTSPQVTGTEEPTHTDGSVWDGDGQSQDNDGYGSVGVEWEYEHSGYAYVRITGVASGTSATAIVTTGNTNDNDQIPAQIVSVGTWKWRRALFNSADGYPTNGTFWRNRLVLARGRWLAMSVSADYENFEFIEGSQSTDDDSITEQLNARRLNNIVWLVEQDNLVVGLNGEEWVIGPTSTSSAVSATNIQATRNSSYGSRAMVPLDVGGLMLFVQQAGRKIRDFDYDYSSNKYTSTDTTKIADHISRGTDGTYTGVVSMAYQQEPYSIVWAARADGMLIGMTYDREAGRSDVYGWHRHPMTNGAVECVETMPSPDGSYDDLWMIVRRTVGGVSRRYIEYMRRPLQDDEDQTTAFYVDCGLSYSGTSATTFSGLDHLEGQTVAILADGGCVPNQVVTGGAVTLSAAATNVQVGLPSVARVQTMQLNVPVQSGTAQGKKKRVEKVITRLYRSLGGAVGPSFDDMEELQFRTPADLQDTAVPLFSGDVKSNWRGGYEDASYACFENAQPLPSIILAFMPQLGIFS